MRTFALIVLGLLLAAPVSAQNRSTHQGFILGGGLVGASLDPEDGDSHSGGGIGLDLAYGFGNRLSIFLAGSAARMEPDGAPGDYTLGQGDLGVRFAFGSTASAWRPFLEGSFNYLTATWEDAEAFGGEDVELRGPGLGIGGGVEYFLNSSWGLGGGLRMGFGSIDEIQVGNVTVELPEGDEFDLNTARIHLTLRYFFGG